jgi:hypothetical protein
MDKDELARLIADIEERGRRDETANVEGFADDGFLVSRAILQVLGRRLGLAFVLDVQSEIAGMAREQSMSDDPQWRADAVEIANVANAGYFTDLIDELSEKLPSGRA